MARSTKASNKKAAGSAVLTYESLLKLTVPVLRKHAKRDGAPSTTKLKADLIKFICRARHLPHPEDEGDEDLAPQASNTVPQADATDDDTAAASDSSSSESSTFDNVALPTRQPLTPGEVRGLGREMYTSFSSEAPPLAHDEQVFSEGDGPSLRRSPPNAGATNTVGGEMSLDPLSEAENMRALYRAPPNGAPKKVEAGVPYPYNISQTTMSLSDKAKGKRKAEECEEHDDESVAGHRLPKISNGQDNSGGDILPSTPLRYLPSSSPSSSTQSTPRTLKRTKRFRDESSTADALNDEEFLSNFELTRRPPVTPGMPPQQIVDGRKPPAKKSKRSKKKTFITRPQPKQFPPKGTPIRFPFTISFSKKQVTRTSSFLQQFMRPGGKAFGIRPRQLDRQASDAGAPVLFRQPSAICRQGSVMDVSTSDITRASSTPPPSTPTRPRVPLRRQGAIQVIAPTQPTSSRRPLTRQDTELVAPSASRQTPNPLHMDLNALRAIQSEFNRALAERTATLRAESTAPQPPMQRAGVQKRRKPLRREDTDRIDE